MTKKQLPLNTETLEVEGAHVLWPKDIPEGAYTLVYSHSTLQLNKAKPLLEADKLYEAWAFDGKTSWHLWKREDAWVCTTYRTSDVERENAVQRKQILMKSFAESTGKNVLVVQHHLSYDDEIG